MEFCFYYLPRLALANLLLLLVCASPARAAESALHEVGAGALELRSLEGSAVISAPMHSSKVHFDISGMLAKVSLEQRFRNSTEHWVEGVYSFPLPGRAAVRHMEMRIGERRIVGEISEREQAARIYREAAAAGKAASLVSQQRPNLFTNRVANIAPGEEITIQLEYIQPIAYSDGEFSMRFPATLTRRYIPGIPLRNAETAQAMTLDPGLGWALPTDQVPDGHLVSPLLHPQTGSDSSPVNALEITASLDMGMPLARVESVYHDIALARDKGVYAIELVAGVAEMDRDFLLSWRPVTGSEPQAALFTETIDGEHYALLMMVPPQVAGREPQIDREVIFVVDTSGSMGGVSIEQARLSLERALGQLQTGDFFNIIEFNSDYRALAAQPVSASPSNIAAAQAWVRQLQAGGGTEMMSALQRAFPWRSDGLERPSGELLRQIIFITDGAVANEAALLKEIRSRLGTSRLFTIAIGSAPNSWFMRKAADYGRGSYIHIGSTDEVAAKMDTLLQQITSPVAVNIQLHWPGNAVVETWPTKIPDLYRGEPLLLAVKLGPTTLQGELEISGTTAASEWTRTIQMAPAQAGHPGVASLWARRKIAGLLDQRSIGVSEETVRAQVLPLALAHSLLSPYTSFIAVEQQPSRPLQSPLQSAAVPNTRPQGQSPQHFAYPSTATTGPAKIWLGSMALFVALMLHVMRRPEEDR